MVHQPTGKRDLYFSESTLQQQLCELHLSWYRIRQGNSLQHLGLYIETQAMEYRSLQSWRKLCVRRFANLPLTTIYRNHHQNIWFGRQSLLEFIERPSRNPGIVTPVDAHRSECWRIDSHQVELDEYKHNDCQRWKIIPDDGTNLRLGMHTRYVSRTEFDRQIRWNSQEEFFTKDWIQTKGSFEREFHRT